MFSLDPWDENRADLRAAYAPAVTAWCHGNKKTKVKDFMSYLIEEKAPQTTEALFAFVDEVNNG